MFDLSALNTLGAVQKWIKEGYGITDVHVYRTIDGVPLYVRLRLRNDQGDKQILPVHHDGRRLITKEPPSVAKDSKPLYGLDYIGRAPDAMVWVVEGEGCADALNTLFARHGAQDDHVTVTSGGSSSARSTDWSPLAGRIIKIWPDHDTAGQNYARDVAEELKAHNCQAVSIIVTEPLHLPKGGDVVDYLRDHPNATPNDLMGLVCGDLPETQAPMLITRMDQIVMESVSWLWPQRIALGKITVCAGNPGLGKSQTAAAIAANVSRGGTWPDGDHTSPIGDVIILSAEDDPADTIVPRCMAAGADLSRCHVLQAVRDKRGTKDIERPFDLTRDMAQLEVMLDRLGNAVRLIIIDPISAYLGEIDSNDNSQTRAALVPLQDLARKKNIAIILVTHFNKSTQQDDIGRVIGSIGMIAAARAGYSVKKDPQNPDLRYFMPIKNNLGNDRDGLSYTIEPASLENGITTSRIVWGGVVTLKELEDKENPSQTTGAKGWLKEFLTDGPKPVKQILEEAEGAGYGKPAIQRAATTLKIARRKDGMQGGWLWALHEGCFIAKALENSLIAKGILDTLNALESDMPAEFSGP